MNINIRRICSKLSEHDPEIRKTGDQFIDDINNELFDDDLLLVENATNSLFDLIFVETGGSETEFLNILPNLKEPIILMSDGKNNSLPAALEIKTYLNQNKKAVYFLTGGEKEIAPLLTHIAKIMTAAAAIENANLGVIGEPSDWLIASRVDPVTVYDKFHINLIRISMDELYNEIDKNIPEFCSRENELKKKYKDQQCLSFALNIYSAIKRLVNKYNLKGLTIRCFDMLSKYKNTACLALALLNEEGIVCACEGDVPSLLTMFFLTSLSGMPSFMANPSYINYKNNTILFAHCTLPLNMVRDYSLDTHFESGLGVAVHGNMPNGRVTIAKLTPSLKASNAVLFQGTIKESPSLKGYCRTQIIVEPEEDGIFTFMKDDFGNHLIVTYADVYEDFYPLISYLENKYSPKL